MRSIPFIIRSMLIVAALVPQLARSQQTAALRAGDFTKISSAGRITEGKVASVGRDSVTLVSDGRASVTVPVFATDTVWTRHRLTGKGAIVGAAFGAVVLGALGGAASSGLCDAADCSGAFTDGAIVGGLVGAGGGGLLGAAIGSLMQRWKRVRP